MKNLVRFISTILLIAMISSIAVPALASGWEERYGTKTLRMNGGNDIKYVRNLQSDLKATLGEPLAVDGIFGNATRNAVIKFQQREGLSADGVVGSKTKQALWNAVN